jgi:hypothetical protein
MQSHLPPGISIAKSDDFEEWQMDIKVLDSNPLYQNEVYRLKFTFGSKYPIGESFVIISQKIFLSFCRGIQNWLSLNARQDAGEATPTRANRLFPFILVALLLSRQ